MTTLVPLIQTLSAHSKAVSTLAYRFDEATGSAMLYSAGKDGVIQEWEHDPSQNKNTWTAQRSFTGHSRWVRSIAVSAETLFSCSWDDTVRCFSLKRSSGQTRSSEDVDAGIILDPAGGHEKGLGVNCVIANEAGDRLYTGSDDGCVVVWDLVQGAAVDKWRANAGVLSLVHIPMNNSLDTDAEEGYVAAACADGSVCLFDALLGEQIETLKPTLSNEATGLCVIGSRIYSGGNDCLIHEMDSSTWLETRTLRGHGSYVSSVAGVSGNTTQEYGFSLDGGPRLFSGDWNGNIKIWDLVHGTCLGTFKAHEKSVNAICFGGRSGAGPEKFMFTASSDGTVKVWDLANLPQSLHGTAGTAIPEPQQSYVPNPILHAPPSHYSSQPYQPYQQSYPPQNYQQNFQPSFQPNYQPNYQQQSNFRPRPPAQKCHFFAKGECRNGSSCRFSHDL
ncbi:Kinesin-like protein kif21b [Chytriomyces hyalinus]|nr:Kinesin-like protein kif21b [Chytriomyces hyalinus]